MLSKGPILKLPELDGPFIVQLDASNDTLGACLLQEYDEIRHPVVYTSKKLFPRKQNYSVDEREALAIIWAMNKFNRFGVFEDHSFKESQAYALEFGSATLLLYGPLYQR